MSETAPAYGKPVRARLTRQGQVTVPKSVREALGAKPGDELVFDQQADGIRIGLASSPRLVDMAGIAAVGSWPWTEDDIERMVADEVGRSYLRKVARTVDQRGAHQRHADKGASNGSSDG